MKNVMVNLEAWLLKAVLDNEVSKVFYKIHLMQSSKHIGWCAGKCCGQGVAFPHHCHVSLSEPQHRAKVISPIPHVYHTIIVHTRVSEIALEHTT